MKWGVIYSLLLFLLLSCKDSKNDKITHLVNEWKNKSIIFPTDTLFISYKKDINKSYKLEHSKYPIVTYIDYLGCTSCKLQLPKWKKLIQELDSISNKSIPFLFFFHTKKEDEMMLLFKRNHFNYSVYFDRNDIFNKLNHFPSEMTFQTFLIDQDNKVVAIGNPIHNPKVKELYLNIMSGKKDLRKTNAPQTTASLSEINIDMDEFDWNKKQEREITISNTGNGPLAISDVTISCGCTTVEYTKEPIMPKKSGMLKIT